MSIFKRVEPYSHAVILTLFLVVCLALADPSTPGFWLRTVWFFLPVLAVYLLAILLRSSGALTTGVLTASSAYFILFAAWVYALDSSEGLIWVSYLFCFPGALAGVVGARILEAYGKAQGWRSFTYGTCGVLAGLALNILILWGILTG